MANVKITDMTPGAALDGTELFESVQLGATVSLLGSQIRTYALSAPIVVTEAVGSSALTLTGAVQVADHPVLNASQTWNNAGVAFTGLRFNATSTASAAGSLLLDLQTGGVSQFSVGKLGLVTGVNLTLTGVIGSSAITVTGVTQVTSQPVLNAAQTWNDGAVVFTGLKFNATSTASAAASLLLDLQVGAASQFSVGKAGVVTVAAGGALAWTTRSIVSSGADGSLTLTNAAASNTATVSVGANNLLSTNGPVKASAGYAVAALPAAGVAGRRAYVTDSNAALTAGVGAIVAAGGANVVPVFDDGTNWRIG